MTAAADPGSRSVAVEEPDYAGIVTRGAAYVMDLFLIVASFSLGVSIAGFVFVLVTQWEIQLNPALSVGVTAGLVTYGLVYFWYTLATFGRTVGMLALGIRVCMGDGSRLRAWRALVRVVMLPLLLAVTLGMSCLGIVLGRRHRALHDVVAGTVVVYAQDLPAGTALRVTQASQVTRELGSSDVLED